jgi:hypothetical protein
MTLCCTQLLSKVLSCSATPASAVLVLLSHALWTCCCIGIPVSCPQAVGSSNGSNSGANLFSTETSLILLYYCSSVDCKWNAQSHQRSGSQQTSSTRGSWMHMLKTVPGELGLLHWLLPELAEVK